MVTFQKGGDLGFVDCLFRPRRLGNENIEVYRIRSIDSVNVSGLKIPPSPFPSPPRGEGGGEGKKCLKEEVTEYGERSR